MSSKSEDATRPGGRQVLGMVLLSMRLYAMVLVWTIPLALLSWPGAGSNDASLGLGILVLVLFVGGMLLLLTSLFCLQKHWLLIIGMLVLSLLAPFVQARHGFFPLPNPMCQQIGSLPSAELRFF